MCVFTCLHAGALPSNRLCDFPITSCLIDVGHIKGNEAFTHLLSWSYRAVQSRREGNTGEAERGGETKERTLTVKAG